MKNYLLKLFMLTAVFALGIGAKAQEQGQEQTTTNYHEVDFYGVPYVGGVVSATVDNAAIERLQKIESGKTVVFTNTANPGYTFAGWYSDEECTNSLSTEATYSAVVGSSNISVFAKYTINTPYNIASSLTNCTITYSDVVKNSQAPYGSIVTFTLNPNTGYYISAPAITNADGSSVAVSKVGVNTYSFEMPTSNVTISATATQLSCTIDGILGTDYLIDENTVIILKSGLTIPGSFAENLILRPSEGETMNVSFGQGTNNVTFTVEPESGYYVTRPTATGATISKTGVNTYSFARSSSETVVVSTTSAQMLCSISGNRGTDYVMDEGDITVITSGLTFTGSHNGSLILKNSAKAGVVKVNLTNFRTMSGTGAGGSIIVSNTGAHQGSLTTAKYPTFEIICSGKNAIVSNNGPGMYINPTEWETNGYNQRPCVVKFNTIGQSVFYIGANSENYRALKDGNDESGISFDDNVKYDKLLYSQSFGVTQEPGPSFEEHKITGNYDVFEEFINNCKNDYHFVQFTMNTKVDKRSAPGGWITACYPYDCTVSGGSVYEVYGRIMWEEGDDEMTESRGELHKLKHLILKLRDDAKINKIEAGKSYFIKKGENASDITFTVTDKKHSDATQANTYESPVKIKGLIGKYEKQQMEAGSYFLNGSQILEVRAGNINNILAYRAYFPNEDEGDENINCFTGTNGVPLYSVIKRDDDSYIIYGRSTGTGGTDWNTNWNKVKLGPGGFLIFDEEVDAEEYTDVKDVIICNSATSSQYYDLLGRKVQTPQKGSLYIVNGKKVLY